jgi:CAP12/Pycsar effector protein, TIR domain
MYIILRAKQWSVHMVNRSMNKQAVEVPSSSPSDFPKHSLRTAIRVAAALEEKNSGNPLPPTDVAIALEKSPGSSDFRVLLSSSIKYGLTTGSYNQARISLTGLARDVLEPTSDETKTRALHQAAFTPTLFGRIFDAYKNKKVPDIQFFQNALVRDFGVSKDQVARCATIFLENMEYLGLVRQASTGKWLAAEPAGLSQGITPPGSPEISEGQEDDFEMRLPPPPVPDASKSTPHPPTKNAIFVGHGKNKAPLQQLEKFLSEYKIPHKVAIEEPNKGRPISQKVADLMKECGAAIIIFTADEEFRDQSGQTIFRPSENAVFELGAASALYGSRVVIFKEAGVTFPVNFRDIGYIEFEKDRLDAKVNELFRELIGFQLITVSVGLNS